jgi:surface antigen
MMNRQPRPWAESLLVAYVDGQLDAPQRAAVEESLRDDAEAQAIVSALRAGGAAVKRAYDEALDRPLPDSLRKLFEDAGAPAADAGVIPFRARGTRQSFVRRALPLAASLAALTIGFGGGYAAFGDRGGDGVFVPAGVPAGVEAGIEDVRAELFHAALGKALEMSDPGVSRGYVDESGAIRGTVTIVGPVATSNLGICREFRHDAVEDAATTAIHGIACRAANGGWIALEDRSGG